MSTSLKTDLVARGGRLCESCNQLKIGKITALEQTSNGMKSADSFGLRRLKELLRHVRMVSILVDCFLEEGI